MPPVAAGDIDQAVVPMPIKQKLMHKMRSRALTFQPLSLPWTFSLKLTDAGVGASAGTVVGVVVVWTGAFVLRVVVFATVSGTGAAGARVAWP